MSGICGIFGQGSVRDSVRRMSDAMLMEGESQSFLDASNSSLAVCRRWPNQSVETVGGLIIAADLDLVATQSLADFVGRSADSASSHATLIALAYQQVGLKVLDAMEGSFAFAIWDESKRKGVAVVDRIGARTLFWSSKNDQLLFATRPSTVAELIGREQSPAAIVQYLLFSVVPAPLSAFRGVERLRPGHYLLWENGKVKDECYWDLRYPEVRGRSEQHWADETREQLRAAVHRHSADLNGSECGAYLSGGTDSSSVTAFLSEIHNPARTYSIYMSDEAYSEIDFARTAAACFKTDHHEECVTAEHALDVFEKLTSYYDEPFANTSAIGGYFCALMAKRTGVNTLLAGDGGDEIFGGNERYHSDQKFAIYHEIPRWMRRFAIEPIARVIPRVGKLALIPKYIARASQPNPRRILSYNNLLSSPADTLLSSEVLQQVPESTWLKIADDHFNSASAKSELNQLLYMDVKITLADNDLRKVNGTAELAGIQVRYPMLDRRLMEFSGTIPSNLKLKGREKRYIFKQAMKPILPAKILYKKKHGFGIPVSIWMLQDKRMNQMVNDVLHDRATRQRGIFAPKLIDELLELHKSEHAGYYGEFLWYVVMLEMWFRKHLECRTATAGKGAW